VKIAEHAEGAVSVSPDDKQVSFMRCNYRDDDFCSLHVINADGKDERSLLTRQRPFRLAGAQFSPDGKSIAFASGQSWNGGSDFRLMRLDLASGAENQISPKTFFDITNLKWLPDGDGLLLAAKETNDGRLRIWHVSTATGEARALTKDATDYVSLSLDKAADRMIATYVSNTFHLYLARMDDPGNQKSLATARTGVAFAPDGKIVYAGNDDIWTINRDGGEQRQLTNNSFSDVYPRVSPDGHYIFFTSNRSGSTQVWRMNVDGSNQIQLTKQEGGYPRFVTPDSKWVYFLSGLHQTLWRISAEGGEESQVSFPSLAFSPDGNFVAYFFHDREGDHQVKLAVMSVEDRRIVKTFHLADDKSRPLGVDWAGGWAGDSKSFYYVTADGSRNHLWRQSLDDEKPSVVGDLGNEEIAYFELSPDGKEFAFIRGRWIHDAVLIEGLK
jgi:Tol biopolymer transport system component